MKTSYFVFFLLLLSCLEARKLNRATKSCPLTATTTSGSTTTASTTTSTASTPTTTTTTSTTTPTTSTTTTTPTTSTTTTTPTTSTTTTPTTSATRPSRLYGAWLLTEDDTVPTPAGWYPKIRSDYPFNTYWLSFLNPNTIFVDGATVAPSAAFTQFSLNRDKSDGPKSSDLVFYSIGGYSYSQTGNNWSMFDNDANAKAFAAAVVSWKKDYRMDGFDLDWEIGSWALSQTQIQAIYTFITTVKQLDPTLLISVEEGGYPQFAGASVIAYADSNGLLSTLMNSVDYFNVMFYSVETPQNALYWVQSSWQKDCTTWCALGTQIPSEKIILGVPGCCDQASTQSTLKNELCAAGPDGKAYGGYMIWYVSSDSTPNIVYGGVCSGSLGCQMNPSNSAYFSLPTC